MTDTSPENVEQAAQALLDAPREALDTIRMTRESAESYAALLRALVQEREMRTYQLGELVRIAEPGKGVYVGSLQHRLAHERTAALEEATAVLGKWLEAAELEGRYQANVWLTDALDEIRTLAAQARGESK